MLSPIAISVLPVAVFVAVAVPCFIVALLVVRAGARRENQVLAGGKLRAMIFGPLTPGLAGILPFGAHARTALTRELRQAGYYHRLAADEYLALRNVLVVGWAVLIGVVLVIAVRPGELPPMSLLLAGPIGVILLYAVPRLILRSQARARVQRIQYALPDALDMITMCMSGGLPMQQALTHVSTELNRTHPDLACELRILGRQTHSGSLSGALAQFADRMNTPDVQSLATMIEQTERLGSNVGGALQDFADGVRLERRQRAEEHGNKTAVKMLFPLVFCLAPPVYLMLLTPAVIELRNFVVRENGPDGILTPRSVSAIDNPTASALNPLPRRPQPNATP